MFENFMNQLIIVFYNVYRDGGIIHTYYKMGKMVGVDEDFINLEYTRKPGNVLLSLKSIVCIEHHDSDRETYDS